MKHLTRNSNNTRRGYISLGVAAVLVAILYGVLVGLSSFLFMTAMTARPSNNEGGQVIQEERDTRIREHTDDVASDEEFRAEDAAWLVRYDNASFGAEDARAERYNDTTLMVLYTNDAGESCSVEFLWDPGEVIPGTRACEPPAAPAN